MSNKIKPGQIVRVGASIATTLVRGKDGRNYWHCTQCRKEVAQRERCPCCGKTIREKR